MNFTLADSKEIWLSLKKEAKRDSKTLKRDMKILKKLLRLLRKNHSAILIVKSSKLTLRGKEACEYVLSELNSLKQRKKDFQVGLWSNLKRISLKSKASN